MTTMSDLSIHLPTGSPEHLPREIGELTRRWGIGRHPLIVNDQASSSLRIANDAATIVIPHHDLSTDHARWHEETANLLAQLPTPQEVLDDPEAVIAALFREDCIPTYVTSMGAGSPSRHSCTIGSTSRWSIYWPADWVPMSHAGWRSNHHRRIPIGNSH